MSMNNRIEIRRVILNRPIISMLTREVHIELSCPQSHMCNTITRFDFSDLHFTRLNSVRKQLSKRRNVFVVRKFQNC